LGREPHQTDLFGPQTQLSVLLNERELLQTEIEDGRKSLEHLKATLEEINEQIGALAMPGGLERRHPEESLFALLRAAG
jgi:hypothetical protein